MKNNGNKKEYSRVLFATITLLALVSGYLILWMQLESTRKDVIEKKQMLYAKTNIESSDRSVSDLLKRTATSRYQINEYLLQRDNFVATIEQIEGIAKISNVDLQKNLPKGDEIMFKLAVTGSFDNIMYFLRLIETMPYRVEVKRSYVEELHSGTEGGDTQWKGSMDILIYGYNLTPQK